MIRRITGVVLFVAFFAVHTAVAQSRPVYPYAIPICTVIINEMTEGKVGLKDAREVALAIARAGNKHFGRVTCGDMWLYMAIVYVESGFRNNIINEQNCRGMFQVHAPSWARKFGVNYSDLLNLQINADCGVGVFKYYLHLYKTVVPTLSAYNSDHPQAAIGYAGAVLGARKRIKRRYAELYHVVHEGKRVAYHRPM